MNKEKPALAGAGRRSKVRYTFGKDSNYFYMIPTKGFGVIQDLRLNIPGFKTSRLLEVVSMITAHSTKREGEKGGWGRLSMLIGREIVPGFDLYIRKLIDLQIIERRGGAVKLHRCYEYRITDEYWGDIIGMPLTDISLLRRIKKAQRKHRSKWVTKYRNQDRLVECMMIDDKALSYIEQIEDVNKRAYAKIAYYRIVNEDFFHKVDKTSFRYHSNLTNLPKGLRQYITVNHKRLKNIDIRNCHPYLLILILTQPEKAAKFARSEDLKKVLSELKVGKTRDIELYINLTTSGLLYDFLVKEFSESGLKGITRENVKKEIMLIIFDKGKSQTIARKIFIKIFPEVYRVIMKVKGKVEGDKYTNFKRLPILLQTIETHIMLEKVLTRIYKENPEIIALTIHDSIFMDILFNHKEKVKEIIKEEFLKVIGYEPMIKEE